MLKHFKVFEQIGKVLFYLWFGGFVLAMIHGLIPGRTSGYQRLWSYYMCGMTASLICTVAVVLVARYLWRKPNK